MTLSNRSQRRRAWLAAIWVLFVGAAGGYLSASPAPDKKKPQYHPPPPRTLPEKVERLASQLLSVPLDESDPITSQIQQLVVGHLQDWFATQTPASTPRDVPYDVQVRREMEKAFSELQYPLYGQCVVFSQSWKGALLTGASYTLGWSDYDRANVVALFETRDGKTRLAGIDHFVRTPIFTTRSCRRRTRPAFAFWFMGHGSAKASRGSPPFFTDTTGRR